MSKGYPIIKRQQITQANGIYTASANFTGILSPADVNVQLALETIDQITQAKIEAVLGYGLNDTGTGTTDLWSASKIQSTINNIPNNNKGYYATESALTTAYPTGENGWYAIVGATDTVWIWDGDTSAWVDGDTKGQVISVNGQTGVVVLDFSPYALKTNVLELNNVTPFTPDADYEPATKKYVDDTEYWKRVGTTVSPKTNGDTLNVGDGTYAFVARTSSQFVILDTSGSNAVMDLRRAGTSRITLSGNGVIIGNSTAVSFQVNGNAIFNRINGDLDFTIKKLTSGDVLNYDAGLDKLTLSPNKLVTSNVLYATPKQILPYLLPSDSTASDRFGSAIAFSKNGSIMAVGCYGRTSNTGIVIIYDFSCNGWIERCRVTASDGATSDQFGASVALSSDGNVLIVGAPGWEGTNTNQGGVYIYDWTAGAYVQRGSVLEAADKANGDNFGSGVALDTTGTILAVGAYLWEGGANNQGGVYIYDYTGGAWVQRGSVIQIGTPTAADWFGTSVALNSAGTTLVAGCARYGATDAGAVFTFDYNGSAWVERANILVPSDAQTNGYFGLGVSISSDGTVLAVGAPITDLTYTDQGQVYVYDLVSNVWTERLKFTSTDGTANTGEDFGFSVCLSGDASLLMVGAEKLNSLSDKGSVYTYALDPVANSFPTNANGNVGFGTLLPSKKVEINDKTGDCLRLSYNRGDGSATVYADFTVSSAGILGISSPILLKAGTTTEYPIKFQSGSLLATPQAGAMEYDGNRYYLTETDTRRVVSIASDAKVNDTTVANTVTETTLYSVVVQSENALAGKVYRIPFFGQFSTANASDTLTLRLKVDGTALTINITPKLVTNVPFHGELMLIIRTTGASGTFAGLGHFDADDNSYDTTTTGSIDTTTDITLQLTAQWDSADADNTVTLYGALLEDMN